MIIQNTTYVNLRATSFNSEGTKINDSLAPPGVRPPGYAPDFLSLAWQEDVIDYVYKASYPSNTSDHQPIVAVADNIFSASREIQPAIHEIQRYQLT